MNKRQRYIIEFIEKKGRAKNREILEEVEKNFDSASRITIIRDLNDLQKKHHVGRHGRGRGVFYTASARGFLKMFDVNEYFKNEPDERKIITTRIDFMKKKPWDGICGKEELKHLDRETEVFQKRKKKYDKTMYAKELERITVEFSWKSSHIEGNTYTLLDTERLLKEHEEAKGHSHEEAVMIINHKKALEFAAKNQKTYKKITRRTIEEIHELIGGGLGIKKGIRNRAVGIIGTTYKPYDTVYQIRESLESLCEIVSAIKHPFHKALIAVAGISYIQPFEDGNKRTARLIGNAILIAHNWCPLSYRSIDEVEYKKAVILFYEQHSLEYFKKLFMEQYTFAVNNYFL